MFLKLKFKQLFCNHTYKINRIIHGDEINKCGGNRYELRCIKCGKFKYTNNIKTYTWDNKVKHR